MEAHNRESNYENRTMQPEKIRELEVASKDNKIYLKIGNHEEKIAARKIRVNLIHV